MAVAAAVKPSLTIKRRFNAPPEKVYAAWTDPEKVSRWMGPTDVTSVRATCDVRVGGGYHITMVVPNDQHDVSGVYREVVPNEKLVFTWAWKSTPERVSLVTLTFTPDGAGTLMTLLHEQFFDEDARDRHNRGWSGTMEKLAKYLEQQESTVTPHGHFHWNELLTRDLTKAKKFYGDVIGWTFEEMPTPNGPYWVASMDGQAVGGLFPLVSPQFDGVPESWMSYLSVDDVDARVKKAEKAGAQLMRPLFDIPGVGRIAMLTEPGGAGIGWITPVKR